MFCFGAALRNLKFNKLAFALTFVTVLIVCALMTLSLRVFLPAYTAFKNGALYNNVYEAMAYTTVFVTVACVICAVVMLYGLAPSASGQKRAALKIYSEIGATKGQLFAINLIEMLAAAVAACPPGIILGEIVLYTQKDWISAFAGAIVWQNGCGVWIFVAAVTLVCVVFSCLIFSFQPTSKFAKAAKRDGAPSRIYASERGFAGVKLGWVNFVRRRRPVSVFVMVFIGLVVFHVLCNSVSYAVCILQSDINTAGYDYNVRFTYDLYDACMETYDYFNKEYDCAVFSSPNVNIHWTTEVTDACAERHITTYHPDGQENAGSNCIPMIVPDENFDKLIEQLGAVISPNEAEGMCAILINYAYSSSNYMSYHIFDNTAVPSYGTLEPADSSTEISAPVTVVCYTDVWPEGYEYDNSYVYGLIMRQSDYTKYFGALTGSYSDGYHCIRFSNAEGIYDEIYSYVSENYDVSLGRGFGSYVMISDKAEARFIKSQAITFVENYIDLIFAFSAAVLFLNVIFMLNREAKSRRDEFHIFRTLGVKKSTMFTMLFCDCFLYFLALFVLSLVVSVLLLLPLHRQILGYYTGFYMEWIYSVACFAAIAVISVLFALQKTIGKG